MSDRPTCAACGVEIPEGVSSKLCPDCILKAAFGTEADLTLELSQPPTAVLQPVFEKPGDRIGRYKLLEQIGEGGCGVVYLAEQEEPVRRRVALKVIKPGMDSKQVLARFEAERQALAIMDHPGIAKVLDAGATQTGHPYFVMELVKGQRITEYCDSARLTTRERLSLFIEVCQAVQHAHQKGIIHRDIKPSNILVSVHDGHALPKVIDFGIAKATSGQPLTNKTVFTALDQFIGTPAYMSPEQAEARGQDIDTRSDVYSLGVLLYELLTGQTPFATSELLEKGLDEIRRVIREQDPPRPSTKLSTLAAEEQTTIARQRRAEPVKLLGLIRGDLDWIVMKSLEKERQRRYESASALAADVQRHLSDEPVMARPPSQAYRLRKLVRRHKLAIAAVAAVVGSLLVGFGLSTVLLVRERAAVQKGNAVNRFLVDDILRQGRPQRSVTIDGSHPNPTFRDTLYQAASNVPERFKAQPQEEEVIELALGDGFVTSGDPEMAVRHAKRALDLRRTRLGPNAAETLDAMVALSQAYISTGASSNAVPLLQEVLRLSGSVTDSNARTVITAKNNLAYVYLESGRLEQATALYEETLKLAQAKLGVADHETLSTMINLAGCYRAAGKPRYNQVLPMLEAAREIARTNLSASDPYTLQTAHNLAVHYMETKPELAPKLFQEVLDARTASLGPVHPDTLLTVLALGQDWLVLTNFSNAERVLRQGLDAFNKKNPNEWVVATIQSRLGIALFRQKKYAEAEPFLVEGYNSLKLQEADIPPEAGPYLAQARDWVARIYRKLDKTNELQALEQKVK